MKSKHPYGIILIMAAPVIFAFLAGCAGADEDTPLNGTAKVMALAPDGDAQYESNALEIFTPTPAPPTPVPTPAPPAYTVDTIDAQEGYVVGNGVNMRSGPHTDYDILAVLRAGDSITITGASGDWYRIVFDETEGFLSGEFAGFGAAPTPKPTPKPFEVTKMNSTTAFVNAGSVNFREGPGRSYAIIGECARYEKVTITGVSGDWYRVKYNKQTGFMLKTYVR
ncbi:MAG: SH3 domain-containing protein, partial [Clostridiales bacterium]|nr:SH3 domain-containing protein [Clostridiales bacterium]